MCQFYWKILSFHLNLKKAYAHSCFPVTSAGVLRRSFFRTLLVEIFGLTELSDFGSTEKVKQSKKTEWLLEFMEII